MHIGAKELTNIQIKGPTNNYTRSLDPIYIVTYIMKYCQDFLDIQQKDGQTENLKVITINYYKNLKKNLCKTVLFNY